MIIGLTGWYASGKGEVAKHLERRGFTYHSLSDVLRNEVALRGLPDDRHTLIELGQALRREQGSGVLAKRLEARLTGRDVVDSIRHPEEIKVLRAHDRMVLIGIEAPAEIRFQRLRGRNRRGDSVTFEEFTAQEAREDSADPTRQQLGACLAMADIRLPNVGTLEELLNAVDDLMKKIPPETPKSR